MMITANVEQAREFLLVSSAREPALIIWRVGPMGTIQTMVRLPTAKKQKKGRYNDRLWITVKWPVPNKIYCSSGNNELVQWTIPKCGGDGLKVVIILDRFSPLLLRYRTL
nr:unnamed protein product [Callosobruchus chinensis]